LSHVVFIHGSPSGTSRSTFVATSVAHALEARGVATRAFTLRDFDAQDLLAARTTAPTVARLLESAASASGLVLSSPVYKGTYAGALKVIVDLLPPDGFVGKPALGIATTKLASHGKEASSALANLFGFFRARTIDGLVLLDDELVKTADGQSFHPVAAVEDRITGAARALLEALTRP
jgi:FMN reductase